MRRSSGSHLTTYISILLMVILGPLGNVLLKEGMKQIAGAPTGWTAAQMAAAATRGLGSGTIWLGFACLTIYVLAEMVALTSADYSYVQPASAAAYGIVALLGFFVLGEPIALTRWIGVLIICVGVSIVARTSPRTTGTKRT